MLSPRKLPQLLLVAVSILLCQGCSTLTTGPTEISGAAVATAIGHIKPSKRDTCETQVQIAAQSSKIATFQAGKEVTYKPAPPCDKPAPAPAPVAVKSAPKVSQLVCPISGGCTLVAPSVAHTATGAWTHERGVVEIDAGIAHRVASLEPR